MIRVPPRRAVVVALALAALAGVATAAPAQIGGLIKKKIAAAATGQEKLAPSTGDNVAFDNITLELTPERIDKVIAGKQAGQKIADSPTGANALREKKDALDEQLSQLREKNGKVLDAWETKRYQIKSCRDSVLSAIEEKKAEDFQANAMNNPELLQKMMDLGNATQQAITKGDTAQARKLMQETAALMAPTRADSLATDRKCGSNKDAPAVAAQAMSLQEQIDQLLNQIRDAEVATSKAELQASGLTSKQLAMACERIQLYLDRLAAKGRQTGFTSAELDALRAREKDLKGLCT